MKKLLLMGIMLLSFIVPNAFSDSSNIQWMNNFGGILDDWGESVANTSDGGYVIAGYTYSYGNGSSDFYLIKADSSGNMQWNKTYGWANQDEAYSVQQTNDSGYIIAGTRLDLNYTWRAYLVKTDSNGNLTWERPCGPISQSQPSYARAVQQTNDGGFIIGGYIYTGSYNCYAVKTDFYGNPKWNKTFGGASDEYCYDIKQTNDGGYILTGITRSFSGKGIYIVKLNSGGNLTWEKAYGGSDDIGFEVYQSKDNGFVVTGYHFNPNRDTDLFILKTNANGTLEWFNYYGAREGATRSTIWAAYWDQGNSIIQSRDGGYVAVGKSLRFIFSPSDWSAAHYFLKTDASGNVEWEKSWYPPFDTFDGNAEESNSVRQTQDSGYIIAGTGTVNSSYDKDVSLFKLSAENFSSCSDGTPYNYCSWQNPLFCSNGSLADNCQLCGCDSGYVCQANGSCKLQSCVLASQCGNSSWIGGTFCCAGDICQRYRNYSCDSSNCYYMDTNELKQECPSYCGAWNKTYCGFDGNIGHNRTCFDKGCSDGICIYVPRFDDSIYQNCQYGCINSTDCKPMPDESNLLFYEPFNNQSEVLSNNGTLYGNVQFRQAPWGNFADMTLNAYTYYPLEGNFLPNHRLTIEFWFRNNKSASQGFFDIGLLSGLNPNSMGIFYSTAYAVNRVITEIRNNLTQLHQAHAPGSLIGYRWNHVAVTFSEYNNGCFDMITYWNGEPSSPVNVCSFEPNMSRAFRIGFTGWYGFSNAYIDEFKIFDYVKSSEEIYNDYLYMKNLTYENLTRKECILYKPQSTGNVKVNCSGMYVNNQSFRVKGLGYQPIPIGKTAENITHKQEMQSDPRIYRDRDFPLIREMNVNAIKTWDEVRNKSFLDAAYNNGTNPIYVLMGFWINCGEDYSDPVIRENYKNNFTKYIMDYKDHPAVLGWLLGNENNLAYCTSYIPYMPYYHSLCNELAKIAYDIEGSKYHPIGIVNGDIGYIGMSGFKADDQSLNYTDFWGSNVYPGRTFGNWFEEYASLSGKPLLITEYGIDAWHTNDVSNPLYGGGYEYENVQAEWDLNQWREIEAANMTIGSALMEYSDEWWKSGSTFSHDYGGYTTNRHPDGYGNEEWWGVVRVRQNTSGGIDIVEPRRVYYILQSAFAGIFRLNITLSRGWNLISIPFVPDNRSVGSAFNSVKGNYSSLFIYSNGKWKELNNNSLINETIGIFVYMKNPDVLRVEGNFSNATINLLNNWDLIGYPSIFEKNISEVYTNVTVFAYLNSSWYSYAPGKSSGLSKFSPGYGYWVRKK